MRKKALYTAVFFNYIGYYVYLLLLFYAGLSASSTGYSMLLRLVILGSLVILFFRSERFKTKAPTHLFLLFSFVYIARILVDDLRDLSYFVGTDKLLLYYLSFDMIPFFLISNLKLKYTDFASIRKGLLFSGLLFSILSLFFFRNFIGNVGRLTTESAESDMLSPLALSYCSSLAIGIALSYWLKNKISVQQKFYLALIMVLAATPFFLGASRGSLIALFFPFLLMMVATRKILSNLRLAAIIFVAFISIIYLSEIFGSSLIERFTQTNADIQEGNESAVRTVMWQNALNQFSSHPVMGDRLKLDGFDIYPHNIFIEILQCTGLLGFIPFFILTLLAIIKSMKIFRYQPAYSWLSMLYFQCVLQNMFSGGLFSASWLMMSMALIFSFDRMQSFAEPSFSRYG